MVNHDAVLELKKEGKLADLSAQDAVSGYTDIMRSQMEDEEGIFWLPTRFLPWAVL